MFFEVRNLLKINNFVVLWAFFCKFNWFSLILCFLEVWDFWCFGEFLGGRVFGRAREFFSSVFIWREVFPWKRVVLRWKIPPISMAKGCKRRKVHFDSQFCFSKHFSWQKIRFSFSFYFKFVIISTCFSFFRL